MVDDGPIDSICDPVFNSVWTAMSRTYTYCTNYDNIVRTRTAGTLAPAAEIVASTARTPDDRRRSRRAAPV